LSAGVGGWGGKKKKFPKVLTANFFGRKPDDSTTKGLRGNEKPKNGTKKNRPWNRATGEVKDARLGGGKRRGASKVKKGQAILSPRGGSKRGVNEKKKPGGRTALHSIRRQTKFAKGEKKEGKETLTGDRGNGKYNGVRR